MIIGIIGPKTSCEKIKNDLHDISPETQIFLYIREASKDAIEVIEQCERECDAILFTGRGPCASVKERYDISIPYDHIAKEGASLTKTFLDMQEAGFERDYFSIDVAEPHVIEDVFNEMSINPTHIHSHPFATYDESEYINWHLNLWKEKEIKAILTGFVRIYDYFKEQGYPVFYLPSTRSTVRSTFERLKNSLALEEAHYSQIAVEKFRITVSDENSENYYSNMIKKSEAESFIIHYSQKIQASFFSCGSHEYVIFTNKGCAQNEGNYNLLYKLQKQISHTGFHLNVGIGTSITAYQSEVNARKALLQSVQSKENYIYLVNGNDNLIGPLGKEQEVEYELVSSDSKIVEISEKTKMSAMYISKLMLIIKIRKDAVFDMTQLADCLHISVRSARRVVNKLIASGYARVYAKESNVGGGRPKNLIEIHF